VLRRVVWSFTEWHCVELFALLLYLASSSASPRLPVAANLFLNILTTSFRISGRKVDPEDACRVWKQGSAFLPAGRFCFGWNFRPHIILAPQVLAWTFTGIGIVYESIAGSVYRLNIHLVYASLEMASVRLVSDLVAAEFPLFASVSYHRLGSE
jgi:hypothetical protein